jgi:eukaryotic translation initiation factor 2C
MNRILLNLNVATAAFHKSGPLLQVLQDVGTGVNSLKKLKFETNYIPALDKDGKPIKGQTKRKIHIINELSLNKNSTNTKFNCTAADGTQKQVSVQEYFNSNYGIVLKQPNAPVVNYGTLTDPKWVPGELCTIMPGQTVKRLLMGDQTRYMIEFAARRPFQNADSIVNDGKKVIKVSDGLNEHLTKFGIKLRQDMLTVLGRILQPPTLQYRTKEVSPANGAWNMTPNITGKQPFITAARMLPWDCLMIIQDKRPAIEGGPNVVRENLEKFRNTLTEYGMQADSCTGLVAANVSLHGSEANVRAAIIQALRNGLKAPPKFLFVLLASDNALIYDTIKSICDIDLGCHSVCSVGNKFTKERGQPQYFANVALKFNQKLGGVNHTLKDSHFRPLDQRTIVFGVDVTHPSPGSSSTSPSIAGVVASIDKRFSHYPTSLRTQTGRVEMVEALEEMTIERLNLWRKKNGGQLPNKVIVYRDGVSEGQYPTVLEKEYPSFVKAFEKLYGAKSQQPKISIIVVGKRHHTRFYPTKAEDADDKTGNPKPGTIVDRGVTGEKLFDFFLLAHQGLQGTSKPAHYVVLKDENKLGADELQQITHNLCYTFARATRSVSVCPPAYYADLVCERARSYLHAVLKGGDASYNPQMWSQGVHPNLAETMFYI